MNWVSAPVAFMSTLCFYVGAYYLWLYTKDRCKKENLSFSLTCFIAACYDIFCIGLYNSDSLSQGIFWQRLQIATVFVFSISIAWFFYFLTNKKYKKIISTLSAFYAVIFLLIVFIRNELTLTMNNPSIKNIKLGNIIDVTYYESNPGLVIVIGFTGMLVGFFIVIMESIKFNMTDEKKRFRPVTVTMTIFFVATVNDVLVSSAVYQFVYIFEYVFMLNILSMGYVMINEFVDLHYEVRDFNKHLEDKVKERTMDLLLNEIGTNLYVELQNDLLGIEKISDGSESILRLIDKDRNSSIFHLSKDPSIVSNIDRLLDRILSKLLEITEAGAGYIFIANENNELEIKAPVSERNSIVKNYLNQIVDNVFIKGDLIITIVPLDERNDNLDTSSQERTSVMSCPIKLSNIVIGVCYLERPYLSGEFDEKDAKILQIFISQVSDAIGTALIYQKVRVTKSLERKKAVTSQIEEKIEKVLSYINDNYKYDISREGLASYIDIHPDTLGRDFKIYVGKTINEYMNELRIKDAADQLRDTDDNIIHIAFSVGFESLRTFNRVFLRMMKTSPHEYREKKK